jgi:hypothetical protein
VIEPFSDVPKLRFISQSQESKIFAGGWAEFHKRYGKGSETVTVSRVGFNPDKTLALLHAIGAIGHNAAAGELYVLERKNGARVIKFHVQTIAI